MGFKKFALGFLIGVPAGVFSFLGLPLSLILVHAGLREFTSFFAVDYLIHVALNTVFWMVLGAVCAWKRRNWVGFAGFATATVVVALSIGVLIIIAILIAILTVPPGL